MAGRAVSIAALMGVLLLSACAPSSQITIAGRVRSEQFVRGSITVAVQVNPVICVYARTDAGRGRLREFVVATNIVGTPAEVDRYVAWTVEECLDLELHGGYLSPVGPVPQ